MTGPSSGDEWSAGGNPYHPDTVWLPPPPPATPPPAPSGRPGGPEQPGRRPGRRTLFAGGIVALVVALVAGLLLWQNSDSPRGTASLKRDLTPFEQAVEDLAMAPGLRYEGRARTGFTKRDITVTASGNRFGETGSSEKGFDQDVLQVGGKTFTRWQENPVPGSALDDEPGSGSGSGSGPDGKSGEKTPSEWSAGDEDRSGLLSDLFDRTPTPPDLAEDLATALREVAGRPQADAPVHRSLKVDGTPALGLDTPAGRLLVTSREPYRVLRLEPYAPTEPSQRAGSDANGVPAAGFPEVTVGPLVDTDANGMDLTPIVGDALDKMFDTLERYTGQLTDATDSGISFALDGSGEMSCGSSGCSVSQKFTGRVSSNARSRVTGGKVTAVLSASFTIDGQSAGRCTSERGTFPITGNDVSGTLTCSNPGAASLLSSIEARYKADAEAESRAKGGVTVTYSIPLSARTLVEARAMATVEVDKLLEQVRQEKENARCGEPRNAPSGSGTPVRLSDGGHLTETDGSSFRPTDTKQWANAVDIRIGDELRSAAGADPAVTAIHRDRRLTHELTVAGPNTYHVPTVGPPVQATKNNCIHASVAYQDWATKGAHIHIGKNEVRIFPDDKGGIGAEAIRLKTGTASPKEVQRVLDEIHSNPDLRADIIRKAASVRDSMNAGEFGMNTNRAAEMNFLIKNLEKLG